MPAWPEKLECAAPGRPSATLISGQGDEGGFKEAFSISAAVRGRGSGLSAVALGLFSLVLWCRQPMGQKNCLVNVRCKSHTHSLSLWK